MEGIAAARVDARLAFGANRPAAARRLIAAQVAPGVTVTVDPAAVEDPDAVIAAIARVLGGGLK
jgi:hypothetical protein